MAYDKPMRLTYHVAASAVLSTAAVAKRIIGPKGKTGRVVACESVVTTGVTDAAAEVRLGTNADPDAYFATSVPVSAANTGHQATKAQIAAGSTIPADTVVELSGDGAATAGAADITLVIDWS